jgi:hypothetical protein
MKPVGELDGNRHVRFEERGWETADWHGLAHRAHPRLYLTLALRRLVEKNDFICVRIDA